jgi:hypothetical protein
MRLVDEASGSEIAEGSIVQVGRVEYRVTGILPKAKTVYLMDLEGDRAPFPLRPARIGAKFAA